MNTRGRWRIGALAGAVALIGSMASLDAHALALGRITVQSALGEPLRAEIDIVEINVEEASSLRASVGSSDAFRAAGLDYSNTVAAVQVSLQRRADGRPFLRLTSSRSVTEPFVDLILDANWSSGRITRDYTMLFDPPGMRAATAAAPITPVAPILSRPTTPSTPSPPPMVIAAPTTPVTPAAPPAPAYTPQPVARPTPQVATRPAAAPTAPAARPATTGSQVTVRPGDTAGRIAAQNKTSNVSLDQMLVALLRSNPDAFIGGNVNRVRSGAVLEVPSEQAASAISPAEASQTITAQSRNFNAFRRQLAENAPATQVAGANRAAGGRVQANVDDRAAANATPDKLTLSKGAVRGAPANAAEEKIAREREARDAAARVAELSRNISDLNRLNTPPSAATTPAAAAPAAATANRVPGVSVTTPSGVAASPTGTATAVTPPSVSGATTSGPGTSLATPAPAASTASAAAASAAAVAAATAAATSPASAPAPVTSAPAVAGTASASAPTTAASGSTAAPVRPAVAPIVAPAVAETSFVDELLENPLLLPLAGGLLLLLAGLALYRFRQRKSSAQVDSSFLESRLQPDSFFGASGGQRIDTNEGNVTGSSLVYSPSQLDAAGDVDPVAEADVYLAYGRDLQAEEILKEAMRTSPMRVAIHAKLLEIYAKRRDTKAFESVAGEAFTLTHGSGPEWAYITEMGRELDPSNDMYQPGGHPSVTGVSPAERHSFDAPDTVPTPVPVGSSPATPLDYDLDLDLDFSASDESPSTMPAAARAELTSGPDSVPPQKPTASIHDLDMDFGIPPTPIKPGGDRRVSAPAAPSSFMSAHDLDFPASALDLLPDPPAPGKPLAPAAKTPPAPPAPPAVADSGMLEFDLGSLSLDLDSSQPAMDTAADPLDTKFELAEEFRALGDAEGARSLAEEVLAKADGPLKLKAQAFLNALP